MITPSSSPSQASAAAAPAGAAPSDEEAERVLAAATVPLAASRSMAVPVVQLAAAAVMTASGAGLVLAAAPSVSGRVIAGVCALVVAARVAGIPLARRRHHRAGDPQWVAAAVVHERSLPARVPAATMAAAARYLPALAKARGQDRAWLYVGRCPRQGQHTWVCEATGVWEPGGRLMVVLGEHSAAVPAVAAVSLAHEVGHVVGWSGRVLTAVQEVWRAGGCGWAAVGLAGAAWGWPGVLAAAAVFQVVCVLVMWAGEAACDVGAARAEGRDATLAAFGYIAIRQAARRATTPRWQAAAGSVLRWAAGPSHPPLWLRSVIVRATTKP